MWRMDLDRPSRDVELLRATLSDDETERAGRFRFDRDRSRFMVARAALRQILAYYVTAPPTALRFVYGTHGKPSLDRPWSESGVRFNVSHAGGLGLCAVTLYRELGVDVERIRPLEDLDVLAARVFSPRERTALARLDGAARVEGFFNGWTRKEAYIKAVGTGLSHPLDRFDVSLAPGAPVRLERIEDDAERAARWTLLAVDVDPQHVGAVAMEGHVATLVQYRWPEGLEIR